MIGQKSLMADFSSMACSSECYTLIALFKNRELGNG